MKKAKNTNNTNNADKIKGSTKMENIPVQKQKSAWNGYSFIQPIRATANRIYHYPVWKIILGFVEVASFIPILFIIIFFFVGKITSNNQSENDLIMNQIREEIGDATINSLKVEDIHGFGNNSIIITATDELSTKGKGELIILDVIENNLLKSMDDPLGLKSSYKTTFNQTLYADGAGLMPYRVNLLNMGNDHTKELIVSYKIWASTYDAYTPVIYKYSYEKSRYELFGTLPSPYYNNKNLDENGDATGYDILADKVSIDGAMVDKIDLLNGYDKITDGNNTYLVPTYSIYCDYHVVKNVNFADEEAIMVVYHKPGQLPYETKYGVNLYHPAIREDRLEWDLMEQIEEVDIQEPFNLYELQRIMDNNLQNNWVIDSAYESET